MNYNDNIERNEIYILQYIQISIINTIQMCTYNKNIRAH